MQKQELPTNSETPQPARLQKVRETTSTHSCQGWDVIDTDKIGGNLLWILNNKVSERSPYPRSLKSTTTRPAVGGPKTFWEDQRAGDLKKRSPTSKFTWFLRFLLSAVGGPKQILRTGQVVVVNGGVVGWRRGQLCHSSSSYYGQRHLAATQVVLLSAQLLMASSAIEPQKTIKSVWGLWSSLSRLTILLTRSTCHC